MTVVSMNYLLEAGVHFGHQKRRWNPKMKEYIFTTRDDIYIIDLQKTAEKIEEAYKEMTVIAENGGKFLFVGTKKQAQEAVEESAIRTNSYFVNERWLGGTLTNFKTIKLRIKRMEEIETQEKDGIFDLLPKKEVIGIKKEYDKLYRNLRGIRDMKKLPEALVIIDPSKEINAIREAHILGIPVFGIVDTNCDPDIVDYVIPGNDDAVRAVKVVIGVLANAIAEKTGCEVLDFLTDEDKRGKNDANKTAEVKEIVNEIKNNDKAETPTSNEKEEIKNVKKVIKKNDELETPTVKEKTKSVKKEVKTKTVDLTGMNLTTLKALAKEKGIKGYSTMKKEELIEVLK